MAPAPDSQAVFSITTDVPYFRQASLETAGESDRFPGYFDAYKRAI